MRRVVAPLSIVALALGVWFIGVNQESAEPVRNPVPADIEPAVPPHEDGSTVNTEDAQAVVVPVVPAATREPPVEPPMPALRHPYQAPEFADGVVAYLVASGLSEIDSRRIADESVEGLTECAFTYGWNVDERRAASPRCDEDVLQRTGLNETIRAAALDQAMVNLSRRIETMRNLARNRALEASAEVRSRQTGR